MISKINKSNYLRAYCKPATTNRSNLTQYCQSNAQQSTAMILLRFNESNANLIKFEQSKPNRKQQQKQWNK